ncbi:hypothetical protein LIER_24701 [Lithospermum erythrorhizon]|uniref:Reverse transcriptase/retrotransposon-derived protein RNase H-like domain-containing protein n=1 Tax=Lithospermum erythrorhizon TaxID=34254 RepID=A0AAV3R5U7_LITER
MPGFNPDVALHKLHVDPTFKPVKQKKRNFSDEKNHAIRSEIDDLLKAGAIKELQFPELISNVVMASREDFTWDKECEEAFEGLKGYLGSPKLLTKPEGNEELQLYMVVSKGVVSSVLIREESLVTSARKLKAYFQAHPILVVTGQSLKKLISNPAQSRRLTTWAIELSEFEINFSPRTGVKAQALADFVIECTARPTPKITSTKLSPQEPR